MLIFAERRSPEKPENNPKQLRERTNKLNSHDAESGDRTRDHRGERSCRYATHAYIIQITIINKYSSALASQLKLNIHISINIKKVISKSIIFRDISLCVNLISLGPDIRLKQCNNFIISNVGSVYMSI
jgi:hypothetical protein